MKIPHPAYVYNLYFKFMKPTIQELISKLEAETLKWTGITTSVHSMGGIAFRHNRKEIGHIHWNGDLDLVLDRNLTEHLLKIEGIKQHRFVPDTAITFPVNHADDLEFALALLRFSYVLKLGRIKSSPPQSGSFLNEEIDKLPNTLRQLCKSAVEATQ